MSGESVGGRVFGLLSGLRERFTERTREVNGMTEREVIAAGTSVGRIVEIAGEQVARARTALSTLQGAEGEDGVASLVRRQIDTIEAFSAQMVGRIIKQQDTANRAAERTRDIARAAQAVANLSHEARILALNARIEAAHLGAKGAGFAVIATEMQRLSKTIAVTNELIGKLSTDLGTLLPDIATGADDLKHLSDEFSEQFADSAHAVEASTAKMHAFVTDALVTGDQSIGEIVRSSHEALSHLQFQDAVAQGLMRVDGWIHETQIEVAHALDVDVDSAAIAAPMHVELGGDKQVDDEKAGDVLLF